MLRNRTCDHSSSKSSKRLTNLSKNKKQKKHLQERNLPFTNLNHKLSIQDSVGLVLTVKILERVQQHHRMEPVQVCKLLNQVFSKSPVWAIIHLNALSSVLFVIQLYLRRKNPNLKLRKRFTLVSSQSFNMMFLWRI